VNFKSLNIQNRERKQENINRLQQSLKDQSCQLKKSDVYLIFGVIHFYTVLYIKNAPFLLNRNKNNNKTRDNLI
jgi:hypothetical protein